MYYADNADNRIELAELLNNLISRGRTIFQVVVDSGAYGVAYTVISFDR